MLKMILVGQSCITKLNSKTLLQRLLFYSTAANKNKNKPKAQSSDFTSSSDSSSSSESSSDSGSSSSDEEDNRFNNERIKEEDSLKAKVLEASLKYVNKEGWSLNAIKAGSRELNLSTTFRGLFNEYDLVKYFITISNEELEKHLTDNRLSVKQALEWRLNKVVPYASSYSEALAYVTRPQYFPDSFGLLLKLSDSIAYHSLKDSSTDISWYSKRLGIASIYVSTELCLIQDKSENFSTTWQFLERRVNEFERYKNNPFRPPVPLSELFSIGSKTLMNILGRNSPR